MTEVTRPRLLVVAGPNGAGKTTITERGLAHEWFGGCEYVSRTRVPWSKNRRTIQGRTLRAELRTRERSEPSDPWLVGSACVRRKAKNGTAVTGYAY